MLGKKNLRLGGTNDQQSHRLIVFLEEGKVVKGDCPSPPRKKRKLASASSDSDSEDIDSDTEDESNR